MLNHHLGKFLLKNKMTFVVALGLAIVLVGYLSVSYDKTIAKTTLVSKEEIDKAEKEIGEVKHGGILLVRMIEMSLQKVNIDGEQYTPEFIDPKSIHRIEMTKGNISYLMKKEDSVITIGSFYEDILNKWMDGNFEDITEDVKDLIFVKNNKVTSIEITKKSEVEEQDYVSHFFN